MVKKELNHLLWTGKHTNTQALSGALRTETNHNKGNSHLHKNGSIPPGGLASTDRRCSFVDEGEDEEEGGPRLVCMHVCAWGVEWHVNKHTRPGCVSKGWISGPDKESDANPDTIKAPKQTDRASFSSPHDPTSHTRVYQRQRLLLTLRLTQTKSRKAPAASVNTL